MACENVNFDLSIRVEEGVDPNCSVTTQRNIVTAQAMGYWDHMKMVIPAGETKQLDLQGLASGTVLLVQVKDSDQEITVQLNAVDGTEIVTRFFVADIDFTAVYFTNADDENDVEIYVLFGQRAA